VAIFAGITRRLPFAGASSIRGRSKGQHEGRQENGHLESFHDRPLVKNPTLSFYHDCPKNFSHLAKGFRQPKKWAPSF
jgi:hypothetical protein